MYVTFINRVPLAVSAFAPGRIGMRPVPFIPALHSIVCKEYDQLHAAETAFLSFPVMKVVQPVVLDLIWRIITRESFPRWHGSCHPRNIPAGLPHKEYSLLKA